MRQPDQRFILAVDKEVHMVKLLERIIKDKTPYQIVTTSNSLEIPDLLIEQHFDLVISDLKMPGFNGVDLLNKIREQKSKEKVIIITASGDYKSVMKCLSLGAYNYIIKPFSKEQIISVVEGAMQIQTDSDEADFLREMLHEMPISAATKQLAREYTERLDNRFNGDVVKMTEASGLSKWQLRRLIKVNSNYINNTGNADNKKND